MTQAPTVRQILSDPDAGLLPYLRHLLQSEDFSEFKAQLSFHSLIYINPNLAYDS
ncbi:MAG: hypothetical protein F6K28_02410 [Microcoleus sp. SIO2G3]|nr:hypothetical protein [Microcoleus sp. SIO2G3]